MKILHETHEPITFGGTLRGNFQKYEIPQDEIPKWLQNAISKTSKFCTLVKAIKEVDDASENSMYKFKLNDDYSIDDVIKYFDLDNKSHIPNSADSETSYKVNEQDNTFTIYIHNYWDNI